MRTITDQQAKIFAKRIVDEIEDVVATLLRRHPEITREQAIVDALVYLN